MKKSPAARFVGNTHWPLLLGGLAAVLLIAYGPLILHPGLHTACPENDTWNLPIRWSVLSAFREGRIPLWNSNSAFGIPWLATWQTESFYPGTLLFDWLGLSAWNLSGLIHLVILSLGIYSFLKAYRVHPFWAFFAAAIALLNGCAYNHLGSNSSMDTMAWIPWLLWATQRCLEQKPWSSLQWTLFFVLQVFAGYPQIILYTVAACFFLALFQKGLTGSTRLALPFLMGLLFSAAQWLPSVEYFFINAVRLPAVHDNPHFFLPLENLKTFWDFNTLGSKEIPDYVRSPTFFYFNFYSGFLPLLVLALGIFRFSELKPESRFFLIGFFLLLLWSIGFFLKSLDFLHLSYPAFFEPAKSWVLINVFELVAFGLILGDLFPKPPAWKWAALALGIANLLWPVWGRPLERNLTPQDLQPMADEIRSDNPKQGHILIVPNAEEHQKLYIPLPDPQRRPLFKHFVPNSNLFADLPSATFYGSTQPTPGALDAGFYFQYGFPYPTGNLLDMLGVDLLYLPEEKMPSRFTKMKTDGGWSLWKNPDSAGCYYFFSGSPKDAVRKDIFTSFASGTSDFRQDLFLDPTPVSLAPCHSQSRLGEFKDDFLGFMSKEESDRYLIVTQNAMPGWRAWINGKPSAVYIANGIFLGIPLPTEPHKVKMIVMAYEPASFRFGFFLSLLSTIALGGWLGMRNRKGWFA